MSERGARNERPANKAWQAAEAALLDASLRLDDAAAGSGAQRFSCNVLRPALQTKDFADCGYRQARLADR
jgi:Tfp pilus assembly protein PilX